MRHRILTCKNHTDLRWSCKDIAWTEAHGDRPGFYNGSRNIQFRGRPSGKGMFEDGSGLDCTVLTPAPENKIICECDCDTSCLILAPEDVQVKHA